MVLVGQWLDLVGALVSYSEVAHIVDLDAAGEEQHAEAGRRPEAQGNRQHHLQQGI